MQKRFPTFLRQHVYKNNGGLIEPEFLTQSYDRKTNLTVEKQGNLKTQRFAGTLFMAELKTLHFLRRKHGPRRQ